MQDESGTGMQKPKRGRPSKLDKLRENAEYRIWKGAIARCTSTSHHAFQRYGGRGISVCERWLDRGFANFLADMGPRPSPQHSIDRIDNNKGYEPGNCRWATSKEQAANKGNNVWVAINGERLPLAEWCSRLGIKRTTVYERVRAGATYESALLRGAPAKDA